ncbi:hypothetical protein CCHOA_03685 [Corynebacterium choanae]|uniref:Uncharacterized protein n=1 Tax=Corynebacterium choanae TaxID=1862358 RepID=A0A3G6J537_9CORY|nr:hypothetical protein CCHOA_03685 [Corynebacterium choanae]
MWQEGQVVFALHRPGIQEKQPMGATLLPRHCCRNTRKLLLIQQVAPGGSRLPCQQSARRRHNRKETGGKAGGGRFNSATGARQSKKGSQVQRSAVAQRFRGKDGALLNSPTSVLERPEWGLPGRICTETFLPQLSL